MQDAILEATVKFILKSPENLGLALHVKKALPENGEAVARNIILQTTNDFISGSDQNRELARRVVEAMLAVRTELCRRILCAVEDRISRQQKPAGWEIRSSYKDDKKDLMRIHSYLALRRKDWCRETADGKYTSGVQLVTDYWYWENAWIGIVFPKNFENNEIQNRVLKAFDSTLNVGAPYRNSDKNQMWRHCRLRDWSQDDFMMTARSNPDEIVEELANGLIALAKLVEKNLAVVQARHDDD